MVWGRATRFRRPRGQKSLHLTHSLPLLLFNMPRLLHSQVYLTIMWRRSSQFATKKGLKIKNSGLHVDIRTHKVCWRVRTLALNFFFGFSFWNCVHFLIRNLSHADNSAISQTLQVSNFRYLPLPLKKSSALMDCRHYWLKITTILNIGGLAIYCFSTVNYQSTFVSNHEKA